MTGITGAAARKPGWYRGGEQGAEAGSHGMWQWWDGQAWKPLEPGDEAAGNKAFNRRASGWVMGGAVVLVFVGIIWTAAANSMGL